MQRVERESPVYLRPLGAGAFAEGERLVNAGMADFLAGGPVVFTHLEIRRPGEGPLSPSVVSIAEWPEALTSIPDPTHASLRERYDAITRPPAPWAIGGNQRLTLDRPHIMGIVNVTPDSFSDGGRHGETESAVAHARRLVEAGADIIDIGGESTRPGADPVPVEEERRRVLPVIETLTDLSVPISIDTRRAAIMRDAVDAGARIINDVSALTADPEALETAVDTGAGIILMHSRGDPRTMQDDPQYDDVAADVFDLLAERIAAAKAAGAATERLVVDPGIGFGKTTEHNLALLRALSMFHGLGVPLLVGASRKRFIARLSREESADDRLGGSLAVALWAVSQGAQILRVHDVAETRQALALSAAISAPEGDA